MAAALMVSYAAGEGATFDRAYYVDTHMPLVKDKWGPHGLTGAQAYFPEGDSGTLAVAILTFRDAAARDAALGSPEAGPVFGDVPNFTNVQPTPTMLSVG